MALKTWYANLAPRERLIAVGGGGVGALVLLFLLIIEPTAQAFSERQRRVATLESQLEWMQETAAEVEALRAQGAGGGGDTDSDRPPYVVIEAALANASLPSPSRLSPTGDDGAARLEFEQVPFDPLVRLLGELQKTHGLQVSRAEIQRQEEGQVGAQLTLGPAR
ncbi:MAG: type II secretion system protein GspM [Halofilum sp. (in: g-proteobacteria)]